MSLFTEWLSLYTSNRDALRELNDKLGEKYDDNHFYDWRSGKQPLPEHVKKFMREQVFPIVAKHHGVTVKMLKEILESLT